MTSKQDYEEFLMEQRSQIEAELATRPYRVSGFFGFDVDASSPEEAIDYAQEKSGWEWEAIPTDGSEPADPDITEIELAAQEAIDASMGDSNDKEIDLLRTALELALGKLGLEMPDPADDFNENDPEGASA